MADKEKWSIRKELKYEWEPGLECGWWHPFEKETFCSALARLGGPLMVVGDTLSRDMMLSINNHLQLNEAMPQDMMSTPMACKLWEATGRMDPALGLCKVLRGCETPIFFVRNDHLSTVEHPPVTRYVQNHLPWISLVESWGVKAVLLSRGPHFSEIQSFTQELEATLLGLRERHPDILILYRATAPGHKDCENIDQPLDAAYNTSELPEHWGDLYEQNAIAWGLVEKHGGVFLDAETMTALRGDGHKGRVSGEGEGEPDCLHYCTPGPVDGWTRLLYNALTRLLPATAPGPPSEGASFSCPEGKASLLCSIFSPYQDSTGVLTQPQPQPQPPLLHPSKGVPEYDVFFMIVSGGVFNVFVDMNPAVINISAEMALPNSRVHFITDGPKVLQRVAWLSQNLPWGDRLFAFDVRPLLGGIRNAFMARYRHQSVNQKPFEAYCFWRWGVIQAYVQQLSASQPGVSRIYTLDADVVPTRPYAEWMPQNLDEEFGRDITLLKLVPGAGMLWTPAELTAYWTFIQGLYASQERMQWFVRSFGGKMGSSCKGHTEVIPCKGGVQFHVSDMQSLTAFMAQSPSTRRSLWGGEWLYREKGPERRAQMLKDKFDSYSCVVMSRASNFNRIPWTLLLAEEGGERTQKSRSPRGWSIMIPRVQLPTCFAHFQGSSKSGIRRLCQLIRARVNGSNVVFQF